MVLFDLCYEIKTSQPSIFMLPERLPESAPHGYSWNSNNTLPLSYQYDFMPKGILSKFIVRTHQYIAVENGRQSVWKSGVKIDGAKMGCPETYAQIMETWDSQALQLSAHGKFSKVLLNKLMYQIDAINDEFFKTETGELKNKQSNYHKLIPCICEICKYDTDKTLYKFDMLMEMLAHDKDKVACTKPPFENVSIREIFDAIFTDNPSIKAEPVNVFISYAHTDKKWKDLLVRSLASLIGQDLINIWVDDVLTTGEFNPQIQNALNKSEIYLFVVTQNFLASDFINRKEISVAAKRFRSNRADIWPIIFETCDWKMHPLDKTMKKLHPGLHIELYPWLGELQALPGNGKPVESFPDVTQAMTTIADQIRKTAVARKNTRFDE